MVQEVSRDRWSTHIGFILAAVGAAVGLGNIWRFSAVLGQNGGGAYLIPYLIAVFVFAMPLMVLEIARGRQFRGTIVSALGAVHPQFRIIGWLLCTISFLILSYYLVITGWTLAYTLFSVTGEPVTFAGFTGSFQPIVFTAFSVLITGYIVSAGVRAGIERLSVILIPVCITILVVMALYGITLSGFPAAMEYLFTPDFSVLFQGEIWLAAFGQALFSLSVGEGILLTYGAYMAQDQDIRHAAFIITIVDTSVAVLAGIVIFPIVFSSGLSPSIGAELAFSTLPLAFSVMPAGRFFAIAFFALLFFAAITSSVAMLEICVAAVDDALGWARKKTTLVLTGLLFVIAIIPALSYSTARLSLSGIPLLDVMDETVGTIGLQLAAILLATIFTWFASPAQFFAEVGSESVLNRIILTLCRYLIPAVLILTLIIELGTGIILPGASFIPGPRDLGSILQVEGVVLLALLIIFASVYAGKKDGES